jgi:hypothetical protein
MIMYDRFIPVFHSSIILHVGKAQEWARDSLRQKSTGITHEIL